MKPEFVENLFRLVVASEGKAWEYRNGQDPIAVAKKIAERTALKYSNHAVAKTSYNGSGAYSKLTPEERAALDLYIMDHGLVKA